MNTTQRTSNRFWVDPFLRFDKWDDALAEADIEATVASGFELCYFVDELPDLNWTTIKREELARLRAQEKYLAQLDTTQAELDALRAMARWVQRNLETRTKPAAKLVELMADVKAAAGCNWDPCVR
jgi:hypothetical protein